MKNRLLRLPSRRFVRRWFFVLVTMVLALLYCILPVLIGYIYTHVRDTSHSELPDMPYEDVMLNTSDGLELAAWYFPSQNGAAVIALHGAGGNRAAMSEPIQMLVSHGYGVLAFDLRGHGESDGDAMLWGWGSEPDVVAAVAYLQSRPDVDRDRIGAIGFSLGGEIMLQAAAQHTEIKAVVSDGAGGGTMTDYMAIPRWWKYLTGPTFWVLFQSLKLFSGEDMPPPLKHLVADIAPRPVMFIAAGQGEGEYDFNQIYYDAAREPKVLWKIDDVGHLGGIRAYPEEYESRVMAFFDGALLSD